jgi:nuclear transcription factor Y, gamma
MNARGRECGQAPQNSSVVERYRTQITASYRDKIARVKEEIETLSHDNLEAFKEVKLPVARIKKIMKSDQDVRMISIEAPILFSKACELFIMELTHKAWFYAKREERKTI